MKIHIAKRGETLAALAEKYRVEPEAIQEANPNLEKPEELAAGTKVKIPTGTEPAIVEPNPNPNPAAPDAKAKPNIAANATMNAKPNAFADPGGSNPTAAMPVEQWAHKHKVAQGDTLWKLSKAWQVPLQALIKLNPHLKNPNALLTGETVYIPKPELDSTPAAGMGADMTATSLPGMSALPSGVGHAGSYPGLAGGADMESSAAGSPGTPGAGGWPGATGAGGWPGAAGGWPGGLAGVGGWPGQPAGLPGGWAGHPGTPLWPEHLDPTTGVPSEDLFAQMPVPAQEVSQPASMYPPAGVASAQSGLMPWPTEATLPPASDGSTAAPEQPGYPAPASGTPWPEPGAGWPSTPDYETSPYGMAPGGLGGGLPGSIPYGGLPGMGGMPGMGSVSGMPIPGAGGLPGMGSLPGMGGAPTGTGGYPGLPYGTGGLPGMGGTPTGTGGYPGMPYGTGGLPGMGGYPGMGGAPTGTGGYPGMPYGMGGGYPGMQPGMPYGTGGYPGAPIPSMGSYTTPYVNPFESPLMTQREEDCGCNGGALKLPYAAPVAAKPADSAPAKVKIKQAGTSSAGASREKSRSKTQKAGSGKREAPAKRRNIPWTNV